MKLVSLRKPSAVVVRQFLERQKRAAFSYADPGCTRSTNAAGYFVDCYRARLGTGADDFAAACAALARWEMFRLGWVEPHPAGDSLVAGACVAVLVRALGLWWLNGCRIVYVAEKSGSAREYGFAYGTLADHAERGEERFWIAWDDDDSVWYELTAISRPARRYMWLGLPLLRRLQRRFAADSQRAMQRAVTAARKAF